MALSLSQDRALTSAATSSQSRRSQGILSRKRPNKDISDRSSESPKPAKKLKVEFDSDVEVKYFHEEHGAKSLEVIREDVRQALRQREAGSSEQYDFIKRLFDVDPAAEDAPTSSLLQKYLFALAANVSLLKRSCSSLVHAVLGMKWLACDERFVALYTRFLGHLASSQGGYTKNILKMLVQNFAHISTSAGARSRAASVTRKQLQQRVHTALRYILQLMPAASGSLSATITSSFPHPDDSIKAHEDYARNILAITEYAPELRSDVLDLLTERLIKIDVQVQIDVDDLEDDIAEDILVPGQLLGDSQILVKKEEEAKEDQDIWSDAESEYSDDDLDPEEERIKTLKSAMGKMDALIDILFEHYTPAFSKGTQLDMTSTFDQLLSHFRKTILPTHRSRHTQFLVFHFAQAFPEFINRFVNVCMEVLKDKGRAPVLRRTAAAYIASFVARGAHVSAEDVRYAFSTLAGYLDQLRREYEPACHGPDPNRYMAYYATCQAIIYIFCFQYRALLVDPEDYDEDDDEAELVWAPGVKDVFMQNLLYSKLNPLKICAPEVVEEFEKIARHLRFLYIYHVIEANKRLRLSQYVSVASTIVARETSLTGLHGERRQQLEAHFPFDPYNLPRSKRWLKGDYNEWKGVPGMDDEASHIDQDSSEVEVGEEDDELVDDRTETPSDSE